MKNYRHFLLKNGLDFQKCNGADGRAVGLLIPQGQGAEGEQPLGQLVQIVQIFDDDRLVGGKHLPVQGQIAVGNVVLNRAADRQFPNTIKEVVAKALEYAK